MEEVRNEKEVSKDKRNEEGKVSAVEEASALQEPDQEINTVERLIHDSEKSTPTPCIPPRSDVRKRSIGHEGSTLRFEAPKCASQITFRTNLAQSRMLDLETELQRLRQCIYQRDTRIRDLGNLVNKQEDIIRRRDNSFNEQIDLVHRQYDEMDDKDEQIRRLVAEAAMLKNENLKLQRDLKKQLSRSGPGFGRPPTETESSGRSTVSQSPIRPRTAQSLRTSAAFSLEFPQAMVQESIFGIPIGGLARYPNDARTAIPCSATLPCLATTIESRPPLTRIPRSLSTYSMPLAPVPEISPPPCKARRNHSMRVNERDANVIRSENDERKSVKEAFAQVFEKIRGSLGKKKG